MQSLTPTVLPRYLRQILGCSLVLPGQARSIFHILNWPLFYSLLHLALNPKPFLPSPYPPAPHHRVLLTSRCSVAHSFRLSGPQQPWTAPLMALHVRRVLPLSCARCAACDVFCMCSSIPIHPVPCCSKRLPSARVTGFRLY